MNPASTTQWQQSPSHPPVPLFPQSYDSNPTASSQTLQAGMDISSSAPKPPTSEASATPAVKKRKLPTEAGAANGAKKPRTMSGQEGSLSGMDDGSEAGGKRAKRNRVHFSCVECHRRKQKCDRNEPCGQCIARKVPNLCRPFINGTEDPTPFDAEVKSRLSRIEDMLASIIPHIHRLPSLPSPHSHGVPGGSPLASIEGPAFPIMGSEVSPYASAEGGRRDSIRERERGMGIGPAMEGIMSGRGEEVFHPGPVGVENQEGVEMVHPQFSPSGSHLPPALLRPQVTLSHETPELAEMLLTLSESGIGKAGLVGLLRGVPGKGMADGLVELYFREIDWTRYKLNRPAFFRRYNVFYANLARDPVNPALDADTLKWLPLMFIVLAIATLSTPVDQWNGDEGQKAWSRKFYASSRASLSYARSLQRDNLDLVYTGLLTARYMLLSRRAAEGAIPLTVSCSLGLYRDGTVLNLTDKREIEWRRRCFSSVYHLDRTTALLCGRPTFLSDAHTDTQEPANLEDEEVEAESFSGVGHPLSVYTDYTQAILRMRLSRIMGKVADSCFGVTPPLYNTILELDKELLDWQANLPAYFAIHSPDTSMDDTNLHVFVQRHLLACEFLFARITLHRPYLLKKPKKDGDSEFFYSKDAAISSASEDLMGRREFLFRKPPGLKVNSGGYRVLNSYIVIGVFIKMDPTSSRADELRNLLDIVAGRKADELGRVSEPIVQDEMKIVDFLTQKANDTDGSQSHMNSATIPAYSHILPDGKNTPRYGPESTRARDRATELPTSHSRADDLSGRDDWRGDPAWSFVAPGMNQIDVQSPFGNRSNPAPSRVPGPLRAPKARSNQQHTSPLIVDGSRQLVQAPSSENIPHRASSNHSDSASGSFSAPGQSNGSHDMQFNNFHHSANAMQLDANTNLFLDPSWYSENLNLNAVVAPGTMDFNPFALSQFQQAEEESSEAAFLNLLLSTIANSSTTSGP